MQRKQDLLRRRFIGVAASGAAATVSCGGQKNRFRFLSNAEAHTLAAVCDVIVPPDEDPSASQAGVVEFIDRQLTGFYRKHRTDYRTGLAKVEALARSAHGRPFTELAPSEQEAVLTGQDSRRFFDLAVAHTMQGYYGSPRHGGNRNWASWRMLRVPPAPVRGRA